MLWSFECAFSSTRDECNKLTKIIQSRVVDFQSTEVVQDGMQREILGRAASNAIDFPGFWQLSSPGSSDHQAFPPGFHDRAVMEAKKWFESKMLSPSSSRGCDCGPSTLNTNMLQSVSVASFFQYSVPLSWLRSNYEELLTWSCSGLL